MKFTPAILALAALTSVWARPAECPEGNSSVGITVSAPNGTKCPSFSGDIVINQYQLYPENNFYDPSSCKLYLSTLFNSSIFVYDLSTNTSESITFQGLTLNPLLHISGVRINPVSKLLTVVIDAGIAFETGGRNISGDNFIVQYDLTSKTEVARTNLTETTQGAYGGYQDLEFDALGNIYVVGTYPSSILKVDPTGAKVDVWYLPEQTDTTLKGLSGLAVVGNTLLSNDEVGDKILRFDMTAAKGTPTVVPHSPNGTINAQGDGIHLPAKYGGKVLLIAQNNAGLSVLRSDDEWVTSKFLGVIPMPASIGGGAATTATQIGESVYVNIEYFGDALVGTPPSLAGNRTVFPQIDVTAALDALLA